MKNHISVTISGIFSFKFLDIQALYKYYKSDGKNWCSCKIKDLFYIIEDKIMTVYFFWTETPLAARKAIKSFTSVLELEEEDPASSSFLTTSLVNAPLLLVGMTTGRFSLHPLGFS